MPHLIYEDHINYLNKPHWSLEDFYRAVTYISFLKSIPYVDSKELKKNLLVPMAV